MRAIASSSNIKSKIKFKEQHAFDAQRHKVNAKLQIIIDQDTEP